MNGNSALIINIVLYSIILFYVKIKFKEGRLSIYLLTMWFVSAISSLIFYNVTSEVIEKVRLLPLLFLMFANLICIYPFLKFKDSQISSIDAGKSDFFLDFCSILLGVSSLLPLYELSVRVSEMNFLDFALIKQQIYDGDSYSRAFSVIGNYFFRITWFFKFLSPVLLFYYLSLKNKKKIIILSLSLSILVDVLFSLSCGSRVGVLVSFLSITVMYCICKSTDGIKKLHKRIRLYGLALALMFLAGFSLITFSRFENIDLGSKTDTNTLFMEWMSLYAGEGPIRFSQYMWDIPIHTEGDNAFSLPKSLFGFKTFRDNDDRKEAWRMRTKIPPQIFYTYVGDFYSDIGSIGVVLLCIFIAYLTTKNIKIFRGQICLENLILVFLISNVIIIGFTYYSYKSFDTQIQVLFTLFFFMFLKIKRILHEKNSIHY